MPLLYDLCACLLSISLLSIKVSACGKVGVSPFSRYYTQDGTDKGCLDVRQQTGIYKFSLSDGRFYSEEGVW